MAARLAHRALLGLAHAGAAAGDGGKDAHAHDEPGPIGPHAPHSPAPATLDLRVAAIFVIAAAALACGLPPLALRAFQSPDAPAARLARAFAGGTILALALVHILPEAVTELSEVVDYPVGGVAALAGALTLVVIDTWLAAAWAPQEFKARLISAGAGGDASAAKAPPGAAAAACKDPDAGHHHGHDHDRSAHADQDRIHVALGSGGGGGGVHTHSCTSALTAQRWLGGAAAAMASAPAQPAPLAGVRQLVSAYTMELGCIFHSVIIGVGIGVITDDRRLVIVLMIAVAVHQALEGLALGSVLALTPFPRAKRVAMLALYAITTPAGIAIGIAVSATYDHGGVVAKAVQGALNGFSSGMLLYISMYQLIAEEFSREDLVVRPRLRAALALGLLAGAACMCVLAVWS